VRRTLAAGLIVGLPAVVLLARWQSPVPSVPPLLSLLPRGTAVTSQARVELDGRPPVELAATVLIPVYPGATTDRAHGVVAGYDRWRRRWRVLLLTSIAGSHRPLEAGPVLGTREVVLFSAYGLDGNVQYRVFGLRWGRLTQVYAGRAAGKVEVVRGLIVERGPVSPRALRWTRGAFQPVPPPPAIPPPVFWRYWTDRNAVVHAQTTMVSLVPGQRLIPTRTFGGPTVILIPDPNLDTLSGTYRARRPGTYTLRIPDLFGRDQANLQLTITVVDENS